MATKGKQFGQVFGEMRGGLPHADATQKLQDLVKQCEYTGRPGTITVTLKVEPRGTQNKEMHVSAKISTKLPADPNVEEKSVFFAVHGDLLREDPSSQPRLGLSGVPSPFDSEEPGGVEEGRTETTPSRRFGIQS